MANKEAERDFFKLIALVQIFNQPKFFMDKLKEKNLEEMYARAKDLNRNGGQAV